LGEAMPPKRKKKKNKKPKILWIKTAEQKKIFSVKEVLSLDLY